MEWYLHTSQKINDTLERIKKKEKKRKRMESNYIKDGWSHILHTFDWFDNELYMQIHIDDIEWLCKFFILQYCCCSISFICSRILLFFFLNLLILINIDIMHTGWIFKNWKINRKLFDCERSMRFNIYKKFFQY